MSCSGLHCAGCGGGAGVPVVALVAVAGGAWVAEHLIEVIAVSAACGVLSLAAVIWLVRWSDRRDAVRRELWTVRAEAITAATAKPQVTRGTPPAVENHVHYHVHLGAASRELSGIPVIPGRVITGKED